MEFVEKWAVVFGPSAYTRVRGLKYSTRDVSKVREAFCTYLGFRDDHILAFGDGLKFPPTRDNFYHELGEFLKSGLIQPDHLLVFYFSGHGIRKQQDYLLPIEASPNNLSDTGIEVSGLVEQLVATKCKNIVMFIDACREDISGQKGILGIGEHTKGVVGRAGVVTIFSCDPTDSSYEIPELEHGSFTYCLLEALKSGKYETVGQVYDYLLSELPVTNAHYGKPVQKPFAIIIPDEKRNLPLFFSSKHRQESEKEYDSWKKHLDGLVIDEKISECYWRSVGVAIGFLDSVTKSGLTDDEKQKLKYIKRFCEGDLEPDAFRVFWEAYERRRRPIGGSPKTRTELEPLS
jgi:hypothetical protein